MSLWRHKSLGRTTSNGAPSNSALYQQAPLTFNLSLSYLLIITGASGHTSSYTRAHPLDWVRPNFRRRVDVESRSGACQYQPLTDTDAVRGRVAFDTGGIKSDRLCPSCARSVGRNRSQSSCPALIKHRKTSMYIDWQTCTHGVRVSDSDRHTLSSALKCENK